MSQEFNPYRVNGYKTLLETIPNTYVECYDWHGKRMLVEESHGESGFVHTWVKMTDESVLDYYFVFGTRV